MVRSPDAFPHRIVTTDPVTKPNPYDELAELAPNPLDEFLKADAEDAEGSEAADADEPWSPPTTAAAAVAAATASPRSRWPRSC
ncbi:hypothetical protein [Streptomyces sp. G45]|uniref:hypothetical protein n=1 Tax=Streptomyces sp. G45 TaxID=3406627 RepID=UPI003C2A3946